MPDWIMKYWVEWIFSLLIAGLGVLYKHLSKKVQQNKEENAAIREGVRSLLRRQIIEDCEKSLSMGFCPVTKKDTIQDMYKSYHALGGNGTVTKLVESVVNLRTMPQQEEHNYD